MGLPLIYTYFRDIRIKALRLRRPVTGEGQKLTVRIFYECRSDTLVLTNC
jgi:hypothetical protein